MLEDGSQRFEVSFHCGSRDACRDGSERSDEQTRLKVKGVGELRGATDRTGLDRPTSGDAPAGSFTRESVAETGFDFVDSCRPHVCSSASLEYLAYSRAESSRPRWSCVHLDEAVAPLWISTGEFDVLATLRRTGSPYTLKPSVLARQVMLTAAGMTSRLDKLEAAGFVKRFPDPDDRRSAPVGLTAAGIRLIDKLVVVHLGNEERLFETLKPAQQKQLDSILRALGHPTG